MSSIDRFSVVLPMQHVPDDTEIGIPMGSAILDASKLSRPQRTADDELHHTTVQHSKLNQRALSILEQQRKSQQPSTLRIAGGPAVHRPQRDPVAHDVDETPLDDGVFSADDDSEEPYVRVSVQTNVPLKGKTAFTLRHRMSEPIETLRQRLVRAVGLRPTGPVSLHRSDTGEELPNNMTLLDLGFRFPPLLRVKHYVHEVYLTLPRPLMTRIPIPWTPSMTLTDLMHQAYKRIQPRHMHHVRLSTRDDAIEGGSRSFEALTSICLLPAEPLYLSASSRLCDVVSHTKITATDPVSVILLRSKEGFPCVFTIPSEGSWSIESVMDVIGTLSSSDALSSHATLFGLSDSKTKYAAQVMEVVSNATPYDDEDEEVYLMIEEMSSHGHAASRSERHSDGRRLFKWTPQDFLSFFSAVATADMNTHCTTGFLVSFAPPPSVMYQLREPSFVSIDADFRVPHLSDLRVTPGAEVLCEMFDPLSGRWSGALESMVTSVSGADSTLHELITLKCTKSNRVVRVPCTPTTPMEIVAVMLWMSTGALPMFTVLMTDHGRLLAPFETLASANLLPQTTLFYATRPRTWLREVLPDVSKLKSGTNLHLPEPSLV